MSISVPRDSCNLCVHAHCYQPPRMDPFTGRIPREVDAAPYANWNERIAAECYTPLAQSGHFEWLSFNLGGTLARWLNENKLPTYDRIVASAQRYAEACGVPNGMAQPVHHTILPLARRRDKICQVHWGIASFEHRFGHTPEGMWLPEMAVDVETLSVLAAAGIRFTILSDEQVRGDLSQGAGPYRVCLPDDQEIAVFVRDRHLSNAISFNMPDPRWAHDWLGSELGWRCQKGDLILVATDGETFGHHHRQGVAVLDRMRTAGPVHGYRLTTLGKHLRDHPPQAELEIIENSAWSCAHRLDRWAVGCGCTPGDSRWKGALRRALDNLASDLDTAYVCAAERLGVDPWPLRDRYIAVVLKQMDAQDFLSGNGMSHLKSDEQERLLWLLEAQLHRQRMYASCTFFFEDLSRYEPRYAIGNAIRALALTRYATGENLAHSFRRDLKIAVSRRTGKTGADIFDALVE